MEKEYKAAQSEKANVKIKQPPVLFKKTQTIVNKIKEILGSQFLTYWNSHWGSVCGNDVIAFYELLEKIGSQEKIYLFIKSDGGDGEASLRIINLIRQYCDNITALIPLDCESAATTIAIGSNEICMGPMAHLTAVDTSLTHRLSPIDKRNNQT
jgi:ATP-dependent protease ClpP protease subunit